MTQHFVHDGKKFEIRQTVSESGIAVQAFLDGVPVGPQYGATFEVQQDFLRQHGEHIVKRLLETAESDVRQGVYLNRPAKIES
jgi:hypothetical protein